MRNDHQPTANELKKRKATVGTKIQLNDILYDTHLFLYRQSILPRNTDDIEKLLRICRI